MTTDDMGRMIKRRMRAVGLPAALTPHSFRVGPIYAPIIPAGVDPICSPISRLC
jgi:hypothetical protein